MQDIPAEFLPSLPQNRTRQSSVVHDARAEAMRAHMQQRPVSIRSNEQMLGRPAASSFDNTRPASIRASGSFQQHQQMYDYQNQQRINSMRSNSTTQQRGSVRVEHSGSVYRDRAESRDRAGSTARERAGSQRNDDNRRSLPITMAQMETAHPQFASLPAGNRETLTFTDQQLAAKLQQQYNDVIVDGTIVSADFVQREVEERRLALAELEREIAELEAAVALSTREVESNYAERQWMDHMQNHNNVDQPNTKLDYMRPQSHKPKFSLVIFLVTLCAMLAEIGFNQGIEDVAKNPMLGPSSSILLRMGAKRTDLIVDSGEWWRLFVPIILHAGILHFVVNMVGLWNIGVSLEREFGTWKVAVIYMSSGFFGILVSALFAPEVMSVGASGAIFGLFGAAWADLIQNWSLYRGTQYRNLIQLTSMTIINIVIGLMPFLDNFAHLGGLVCGLVLGLLLLVQTRYVYTGQRKSKRKYQVALMACSFIVFPALFVAGYVTLYTNGGGVECDWCQAFSCVPMPPGVPYGELWWGCDECYLGGLAGEIASDNTLHFTCPSTGIAKQKQFPSSFAIKQPDLLVACKEQCL